MKKIFELEYHGILIAIGFQIDKEGIIFIIPLFTFFINFNLKENSERPVSEGVKVDYWKIIFLFLLVFLVLKIIRAV